MPRAVSKFLRDADVIFGIGCSFTETFVGIAMPKDKIIIHSTLDPPATSTRTSRRKLVWSGTLGSCLMLFWKRSTKL